MKCDICGATMMPATNQFFVVQYGDLSKTVQLSDNMVCTNRDCDNSYLEDRDGAVRRAVRQMALLHEDVGKPDAERQTDRLIAVLDKLTAAVASLEARITKQESGRTFAQVREHYTATQQPRSKK